MATKLSRPSHLPGFPRLGGLRVRSHRFRRGAGAARPRPRTAHAAPHSQVQAVPPDHRAGSERASGWQRRALREGVVITLLTSLLTSAVLASPEIFRQSPAVSWRQFTSPALAAGDLPSRGVLLDCP